MGVLTVMLGLMLFLDGVKYGLMSMAESIGFVLPNRAKSIVVLVFAFFLGAIATFAEPAIGVLGAAGKGLDPQRVPYLHLLLNRYPDRLVWAVAGGVGIAVMVGMLRFFYGWQMKRLVILTLLPCMAITVFAGLDPDLAPIVALAWDCGGITTGPVTVPLVLALGLGVAAASGQQDNPFAGFGIVTLASLFPVMGVLLVAMGLASEVPDPAALVPLATTVGDPAWWEVSPFSDMVGALRAITPLILLLWAVQHFVIRERFRGRSQIAYGVVVAILGMAFFNYGLTVGLIPLGEQAGTTVPSAFITTDGERALYPYLAGVALTLAFAALLGYGATIAEPALNAMGGTVESLTDGVLSKRLVIQAVAIGVGAGVALGVAKIMFNWPIMPMLVAMYSLAFLCTLASSEKFVAMAWDSAGVTTGPVTVPLVLALGLGLGKAVGAAEGFGILAMASVGPIITVLTVGLWMQFRAGLKQSDEEE
jgi:hypothetical protein